MEYNRKSLTNVQHGREEIDILDHWFLKRNLKMTRTAINSNNTGPTNKIGHPWRRAMLFFWFCCVISFYLYITLPVFGIISKSKLSTRAKSPHVNFYQCTHLFTSDSSSMCCLFYNYGLSS